MAPLNDTLAPLLRLQEFDATLDALARDLSRVAPERDALRARRKAIGDALEQAKKSLTQAQVDKKNLELDIDAQDQKVRKHTTELGGVKSNDAYKALLSEIEVAKKAKTEIEDRVLILMETIDGLQKRAKQDESSAASQQAELDLQIRSLDAQEADLSSRRTALAGEREAFAATLPAPARQAYDGVRRGRPGFQALAPVGEGMVCGGCRTHLTANVVNQVMKGKDVISCESCSRILFIVPKPPESAPTTDVPAQSAASA